MAISTYLANKLLDHILQVASYGQPTVSVALSTTDPASVLTEPSGNNYARVTLSGKYSAASAKSSGNTGVITFPQASGSWGTITHFAIVDGSSNVLWSDALSVAKAVSTNDTLSFNAANLTLSFT